MIKIINKIVANGTGSFKTGDEIPDDLTIDDVWTIIQEVCNHESNQEYKYVSHYFDRKVVRENLPDNRYIYEIHLGIVLEK